MLKPILISVRCSLEIIFLLYNQNLVIRSTFVLAGVFEEFGVDVGIGGGISVEDNCGKPAAAIIAVIKCCCIINIIIEVAIGLSKAGFEPEYTLLKSDNGADAAILL